MTTTDPRDTDRLTPEELKNEVVRIKRTRVSFEKVANRLGISRQRAHQLYWEAMNEVKSPTVNAVREELSELYDSLIEEASAILGKDHLHVSGGTVVRMPAEPGQPEDSGPILLNDGPKLDAIREIRQLAAEKAKLHGANAPVQAVINGQIHYQVSGVDLGKLT